jgi:hypothetical protein
MLEVIRSMRGALTAIDKRDADLARQLRRAASSARETLACLQTAEAFGYVEPVSNNLTESMNRIIGTLVRVAA